MTVEPVARYDGEGLGLADGLMFALDVCLSETSRAGEVLEVTARTRPSMPTTRPMVHVARDELTAAGPTMAVAERTISGPGRGRPGRL